MILHLHEKDHPRLAIRAYLLAQRDGFAVTWDAITLSSSSSGIITIEEESTGGSSHHWLLDQELPSLAERTFSKDQAARDACIAWVQGEVLRGTLIPKATGST